MRLFAADPTSDIWKAYLEHVDEIVLDGFFNVIECSLKYLLENTGELVLAHASYLSIYLG